MGCRSGGLCDISGCGLSEDCNANGIPDECEVPAVQVAKLLAYDGAEYDNFGYSVSVSGDVAVIGAPRDDDNGSGSGSAYMFRFNGPTWVFEQKLLAGDGVAGDLFGASVSISGDVAVIGAWRHNDHDPWSGSAYVFRFDGLNWVQEAELLPEDDAFDAEFGWSVSVSGEVAVIGAREDDDNGSRSGSAYVFRLDGSNWVQEGKLLADDGADDDWFGYSVSVSGEVAVIGARGDDDNGENSGSVYAFRFNGSTWVQEAKLLADDGADGDNLGSSVSVSGDVAVIGASGDDDNGPGSGSAYVFRKSGPDWGQEGKLLADDGAESDQFGYSVSVSGDVAVIGARGDDDNGESSGSSYVFSLGGGGIDCNWSGIPDECDIADGTSEDCNANGVPDECDVADGTSEDCQPNGVPDECDIADGTSADIDRNGIPDECFPPVPTISEWGLVVLGALMLFGGTIVFGRQRRSEAA